MRPLLAATIENVERDVAFPCLSSPKIDGVRCLAYEGAAMSRSFKPLPNRYIQELFCNRELHGLDGEIVVGHPTAKDCFNTSTSSVMTQGGRPLFTFFVFDDFSCSGIYLDRLNRLEARVRGLTSSWISVLPQLRHQHVESLMHHEQTAVELGYEGIMVRSPLGQYKQGRSTLREQYLMKLKRFTDAEAECVGYTELKRNLNEPITSETGYQVRSSHQANMVGGGMLGALTCKWEDTTFNIGTGFSEADRVKFWGIRDQLVGKMVKFKYQEYGVVDVPRLPVFIGFRFMEDM